MVINMVKSVTTIVIIVTVCLPVCEICLQFHHKKKSVVVLLSLTPGGFALH